MEHYMAEFGQGYVQAAVLSENNAVKYKLSIAGSCTQSTARPYINLQDRRIGPLVFQPGLTVVVFNTTTNQVEDVKNYLFTDTISSVNRAFVTYVNSLPPEKLVIMVSEGKLKTCSELMAWFKLANSTAWPTTWDTLHFDAAYAGFYASTFKSITSEHVMFNDGKTKEKISAVLDVVYDYYSDIGATGVPFRIASVNEVKESQSGEYQELIRLPTEALETPLSDYNLIPGDTFYLKYQAQVGLGTGTGPLPNETTTCSIRWFNDTGMVSNTNIDANINYLDTWQTFERYITVPPGVTKFTLYFYKGNVDDYGAVRNITITEVPREETPLFRSAEIGVNGIRMNTMIDGKVEELLILNDTKTDDRGRVQGAEFREKQ